MTARPPAPPPSPRESQRTRIAQGGVVPPAPRLRPVGAPEEIDPLATTAAPRSADRTNRVGTRMQGAEYLSEPGAEAPKLRLTAGRVVPGTRYRILRWLGEGGMGVVYEAEHIDIERKVALKILRFDLSRQPKMVQVFRDEARAASRLGSRYIVEIYDFGELPDGRLFFAMELLDGHDLVPADTNAVIDPARLIGIMRQVCKGLHGAHRSNVVHRDVKPENLIVIEEGGRADTIKIVDFGISSMLAAGGAGDHGIAGTPHYMAPEQILGHDFDGRLDVYALGCTGYELLTGTPPFDADGVEELLQLQLQSAPQPPSQRRPDLVIPPAFERVLLRCLAKRPEERYADMADLEAALCEAQIADKLTTPWDDLPLPELVDLARRDRLLRDMPSPLAIGAPAKRRWLWPVVAGVSTLAAVSLGLFLAYGTKPKETPVDDTVDRIAAQAKDAAAKLHWVMPPPSTPKADTAFSKVIELEKTGGTSEEAADDRAATLRSEFSGTLVRQADVLWDQGAQLAATNHYLWALAFDPANEHAFERAQVDSSFLLNFIARAKEQKFTQSELAFGLITSIQVESDPEEQARMIAELDEVGDALPEAAKTSVIEQVPVLREREQARERERTRERKPVDEPVVAVAAPSIPPPPDAPIVADAAVDPKTKKKRTTSADPRELLGTAERDPTKAKDLAEQGLAALRAGRRSEASSLFNQAIAFDHTNAAALSGLSDIYFDTGADQKAVVYAEKAVKASPANQTYRLKLGDAYYKVLRYNDALAQYEEAKKRGSSKADERITKVKAKLGG
ncbi:MAG TPA: serine/threonine-protein kinase [Nannocystaceae bacterium]|nr:serine/threonine-protein kinase [Nannocystaceae bacterium]